MRNSQAAKRRHLPTSPFKPPGDEPPLELFVPHDRVSHDTYGLGSVIKVESDSTVLVDFGTQQQRISPPYAKLFKL